MNLDNFKPMTEEQCQQVNGGFSQFLLGAMMVGLCVPIIKNLFTSISGSFKIPGVIEGKWDKPEIDTKEIKKLQTELSKIKEQFSHFMPPFYEF